jgi:NADH:ubiquinone oxidoreductase subunit 5 (chain L)/Multisubunit Na+/H+ antiporter, MnhA subunit
MNSFYPWLILLRTVRERDGHHALHAPMEIIEQCNFHHRGARKFLLQLLDLRSVSHGAPEFVWLDVPPIFRVPFGLTLDQLSRTMAVLVSGVGALIHIYSLGYMRDDEGKSRISRRCRSSCSRCSGSFLRTIS